MPKVEYSLQDLRNLLGQNVETEVLREKIPLLGVDLEDITDESIAMEIFPSRPDMLSIEGFARALKGFLGIETGLKSYSLGNSKIKVTIDSSVLDIRPYAVAAVVSGLEFDDCTVKSIMDMQEKLHLTHGRNRAKVAIGVHDLHKIKPPITYKAVEPDSVSFTPLGSNHEMSLKQILNHHPKGREYAWILDKMDRYPLFVDAQDNVLSFPPIINSEETRLTEYTRDLFIELTGKSERELDSALNIIVSSLADRGGKIQAVDIK
jgi:phenylalanyl-tRNA synthetase beta chain